MPISERDKNTILAFHNNERRSVNPGAPDLQWDPELAAAAQAWAEGPGRTSRGGHDQNRGDCGENMAWGQGAPSVTRGMQGWMDEKKRYHGEAIDGSNFGYVGHYTQMIWKMTDRIGCGWVQGPDGSYALCCRYTVPGNMMGYTPYDTYGTGGSSDGDQSYDGDQGYSEETDDSGDQGYTSGTTYYYSSGSSYTYQSY